MECSWEAPVGWHEPFEGAAILLDLVDELVTSIVIVVRPVGNLVAEDVLLVVLIEESVLVEASPLARPESAVSADRSVTEAEALIGPAALNQGSLQSDVGDVLHLVINLGVFAREERLSVAEDLVDDIAFSESTSQHFVGPVDLVAVCIEFLFVGEIALEVIRSYELKFVGDSASEFAIFERAAIVPHLSDVADTDGKRALVALNHLLAQGLIGDVASLD